MAANTRTATAVQILCVIAWVGDGGTDATQIAKSLQTNPVVVRRILKSLEQAGLVEIRTGRNGGVTLARAPRGIMLDEIHRAVEDGSVLALRPGVNRKCPVSLRIKGLLAPVFDAASQAVEKSLAKTSLASLVEAIG